jgi:DNA-binding transcriptional regulator YiaG
MGVERMMPMTLKELRQRSGMSRPKFAEYFDIPYRTVQSWELYGESVEGRKCPEYLVSLMAYKLEKEGILKAED